MINKKVKLEKLNRYELHRYLGYKGNTPEETVRGKIDKYESKLFETVKPAYIMRKFTISELYDKGEYKGIAFDDTDLILSGESIRDHLSRCHSAVLLCATLSGEADKLIRQTELKDMAEALIVDTAASVAIEQVCNIAEETLGELFPDKYMTYRFGVGYGDLPLYHEKKILDILNAGKLIGLYCSDSNILTPRKSVVCIVGISDYPLKRGQKGCVTCSMRDTCNYRKQGLSCSY